MGQYKRRMTAVCCALLFAEPVCAFWPVLDFGEIIPIVQNVSTSLESLSKTKKQLDELKQGLNSIGTNIREISKFAADIRNTVSEAGAIVSQATGDINDTLGTDITIQDDINNAINKINNIQQGLVDDVVNNVEAAAETGSKASGGAATGIDQAQKNTDKAEDGLKKLNQKQKAKKESAPAEEQLPTEEEEEEEEIPNNDDAIKADMVEMVETAKDMSKKMAEQLDDVFEAGIQALQRNNKTNQETLDEINRIISLAEKLNKQEKAEFRHRVIELKDRRLSLLGRGSEIIEGARDAYRVQYRNKIEDGYKNYVNMITQYAKGDITRDELLKTGEKFKKEAASIDVTPDKSVIDKLQNEIKTFSADLNKLKADVVAAEEKVLES